MASVLSSKADTIPAALSQMHSAEQQRRPGGMCARVRACSQASFRHTGQRSPALETPLSPVQPYLPATLPVLGCQLFTCMEMTAACHGLYERPLLPR